MTNNELWHAVLGELELTISKPNFTTWFRSTYIFSFDDGHVVVGVPNAFTKTWLEKKYQQTILKTLNAITNRGVKDVTYKVDFRVNAVADDVVGANNDQKELNLDEIKLSQEPSPVVDKHGLNPRYSFDAFVVGKGNELAHAAAQAVAARPGVAYNPLFIYGGVGLGKTHLIQAIGHFCLKKSKAFKILYVSCEKFTNDFIHAIRHGQSKDFKERYRTVDLLIIDDIQFIAGKKETQEEFFHTFNELHQSNKQIVLSSDRHPKAIPSLEDRLQSRFQWGMMVDIASPDLETRIAIIETKCKEKGYLFEEEVVHYIATIIQSNVRELEGALNKLNALCQFKNIKPSLSVAKSVLQSFEVSSSKKNVSPKNLLSMVADYYDLRIDDLVGVSREKRLAFPRQIAMFLLREELKSSYPAIGHEIGNRDHTTAMHAYSKIKNEVTQNLQLKQDIENIKNKLYS